MLDPRFLKPRYDSGGFAGIPSRIQEYCASGQYDAVVTFLVDGFGWRFYEIYQDSPILKRFSSGGSVEKLTSQFPSTTAAHLTTLHTGLPVGQSGVYEWFYYEPQVDDMIAPLLFSYAGDLDRDTLQGKIQARSLYPRTTLYQALGRLGIGSHIFGSRDYTPSTYSNAVMRGADLHPYRTLPEALVNLGLLLAGTPAPAYIHFYVDAVDSTCHKYGPSAPQTLAEIETFLLLLDHFFEGLSAHRKRILFLLTADHGASEVDPGTTVFLNAGKRFSGLKRFLKTNRNGALLVPAGSARDMFLYVKDEMLSEARDFLAKRLEGTADVVGTEWLIEQGYFGAEVSPTFQKRVGDLVILPYRYESVWWYEKGKFEQNFYGHHGGLTAQEIEIPYLTYAV